MKNTIEVVDRFVTGVIEKISYVSGVCLVGIMLVAFFNMLGEKLKTFGVPIGGVPGAKEIVQYLHIPVVFMAAAFVTLDRGHVRIDLLVNKFPKILQKVLMTLGYICGMVICTFVSQRGFVLMVKQIKRHKMSATSGFAFPLWPFALIMAVGFALLVISFAWAIVRQYALENEGHAAGGEQ